MKMKMKKNILIKGKITKIILRMIKIKEKIKNHIGLIISLFFFKCNNIFKMINF